ncbi:MAG TPA: glucosaminidase domain-containing protein [Paludibacter sp.]|nr:glucosaminidase domain-containing protein [Paludibacter sp.]
MQINDKILLLSIFFLFSVLADSQPRNQAYLAYIEQYHQIAEKQQKEHGIPASIVLAQGLLESGAGQSELARQSNNHFGIKCSDWTGGRVYHDDDEKDECFRKYDQVIESYEDHAAFLKKNRYAFLYSYKPTDYESWAFGLKKAGYATDPSYAFKLISIIEDYDLHRFDLGAGNSSGLASSTKAAPNGGVKGPMGYISATVKHEVVKVNKVRSVVALPGDTYESIADEFNMSEKRLRGYNEIDQDQELKPGVRVFIANKRRRASKDMELYVVKSGESMHSIAQNYGLQTESLYNLNQMAYTQGPKVGQMLKLR